MHSYANLWKIMHASEPILFSSLRAIMRKVCAKFHPDSISSFAEKMEQRDGRTNKAK